MSALDVLGHVVVAGDRVAAAFSLGNTVEIRVGTVLSFAKRNSRYGVSVDVMEVDWVTGSGFGGSGWTHRDVKTSKVETNLRRFVKLD